MADLFALRDMLDKATGPSRELDRLLATTLFPRGNCFAPNGDCLDWLDLHEPEITNSIDAAMALAERLLPVSWIRIERLTLTRWQVRFEGSEEVYWANATTAPLAILKALIAALIAKEALADPEVEKL